MPKLTIEKMKEIKEKTSKETFLRHGEPKIRITVHMGSCGIAAGSREVMETLMSQITEAAREDIFALASGCLEKCKSEPNVTVEIIGKDPILYHKMNSDKMKQVFKQHVLEGKVQTEFTRA
jgi:NADP-reducing hydrogenase subunit HndB